MGQYLRGVRSGIAIGIAYFSVSFTFGLMAVKYGFSAAQATAISALTLTSAGQLAAIGIMASPGQYLALLFSQITINLRYSFMAVSLSQKADKRFRGIFRWLLGFFITDEIFAVAEAERELSRSFFFGLSLCPFIGWTCGTLSGALLGNILPAFLMSALSLAIYAMFVAIVVPVAKKEGSVLFTVLIAIAFSVAFAYVPFLKEISSGIAISLSAIFAALCATFLFPLPEGGEADA